MDESVPDVRDSEAADRTLLAIVGAVLAAVGGAVFLTWRKNAPLSRYYRRRRND